MMSEETVLADLLALNLHEVEDDVRNIVDKATKELSMEKTLKVYHSLADNVVVRSCFKPHLQELDVTWARMEFDHEKHHRTSILLISASEEVIETLEDNQVCDYLMYVHVCVLQNKCTNLPFFLFNTLLPYRIARTVS